jgi:hypothetical protein
MKKVESGTSEEPLQDYHRLKAVFWMNKLHGMIRQTGSGGHLNQLLYQNELMYSNLSMDHSTSYVAADSWT